MKEPFKYFQIFLKAFLRDAEGIFDVVRFIKRLKFDGAHFPESSYDLCSHHMKTSHSIRISN